MWITLPRYFSVIAKRFSQPQGFLTRSDKLAEPELLFQSGEQLLDPLLRGRLAIDANQRLGAAESDQHPAAVLQVILESIIGTGAHHPSAGNVVGWLLFQPAIELGATGRVLLPLEMEIVPGIKVWTDQFRQVVHDPRKRLAILHDHAGERDPREDAVAFWNMAAEGETATLLAAEHRIGPGHP